MISERLYDILRDSRDTHSHLRCPQLFGPSGQARSVGQSTIFIIIGKHFYFSHDTVTKKRNKNRHSIHYTTIYYSASFASSTMSWLRLQKMFSPFDQGPTVHFIRLHDGIFRLSRAPRLVLLPASPSILSLYPTRRPWSPFLVPSLDYPCKNAHSVQPRVCCVVDSDGRHRDPILRNYCMDQYQQSERARLRPPLTGICTMLCSASTPSSELPSMGTVVESSRRPFLAGALHRRHQSRPP